VAKTFSEDAMTAVSSRAIVKYSNGNAEKMSITTQLPTPTYEKYLDYMPSTDDWN
jgi:hypothetical protein